MSGHYTEGGERDAVTVPVVTLDEHLRERPRLRLVKIDVEGAEPRVLAGMQKTLAENPPDAMLLEIDPRALERQGFGVDAVVGPLRAAGYELRAISFIGRAERSANVRIERPAEAPARGGALGLIWRALRGLDRLASIAAIRGGGAR